MRTQDQRPSKTALFGVIWLALTFTAGGCGGREFQTSVVSAVETATQSIVAAVVTLYFDQYRPN